MRPLVWNLAWLVLGAAWLGPLPDWAVGSFTAHMSLHMAVVAVAAPLLSIAAAGCRYDPVRKWPNWFAPITASVGELIIVWAWHAPGLHHFARHTSLGFGIEQASFLAAGMWVWLAAFGGDSPRPSSRSAAGVVGLLLTSMHMTLLGALLALSPRLLYAHGHVGGTLPPLVDQQLGGAVMLVVGGVAFLAGGLWLTRDLMRMDRRASGNRSSVARGASMGRFNMKRRLKELTILLTVLAVGAIIVVAVGLVPIKASSGHWRIIRWLLDFASDRSVAFHSQGISVPALDEPGMDILGAATYESNCRWCHGRPGQKVQPVATGMTPKPPYLADAAPSFEPAELFYIIQHGIKFAGMPAWPTQRRDDEAWPVVAFLRKLPEMDAAEYRTLTSVAEEPSNGKVASSTERLAIRRCAVCHGRRGQTAINWRVPILAGQSAEYLRLSLDAYRRGNRFSGVMQPVASRLTEEEVDELAAYFAAQTATHGESTANVNLKLWSLGQRLANEGDQAAKIPTCVDCHGPGPIIRSGAYPRLAKQPAGYLRQQLRLFAAHNRGGSENHSLMHPIADKLNPGRRAALAEYYGAPHPGAFDDPSPAGFDDPAAAQ